MMDEVAFWGEARERTSRQPRPISANRWHNGLQIPWVVHDCSENGSCGFCRKVKRDFIASLSPNGRVSQP